MGWLDDTVTAALVALGLATPSGPAPRPGYVEAEFVYVAPLVGGRLELLRVRRGATAQPGDRLFELEQASELANRDEQAARLARAQAQYDNLTTGRRQPEIDALEAQRSEAEAQLRLATQQFDRQRRLVGTSAFLPERLDEARSMLDQRRARVRDLEAQIETARMAARDDELRAAAAEVLASRAAFAQAIWRLEQKTVDAPAGGVVYDTYFRPGEMVNAGQPVLAILPPENLRARFYVPQAELAAYPLGTPVTLRCDGCPEAVAAKVSFISPEAEFTPPVLYNRENRAKMVFLLEATPVVPSLALRPGQPIDVVRP